MYIGFGEREGSVGTGLESDDCMSIMNRELFRVKRGVVGLCDMKGEVMEMKEKMGLLVLVGIWGSRCRSRSWWTMMAVTRWRPPRTKH